MVIDVVVMVVVGVVCGDRRGGNGGSRKSVVVVVVVLVMIVFQQAIKEIYYNCHNVGSFVFRPPKLLHPIFNLRCLNFVPKQASLIDSCGSKNL